jgi:Asp-tRNA(Asn)/Glu-tRNA(Gln) amidotransferase A subunit family amidase
MVNFECILIPRPGSGQIGWGTAMQDTTVHAHHASIAPMLSALDLARRIESDALTPRAVVDLCAQAIARREPEIGAFVTLDLDGARHAAEATHLSHSPLRGLPVGIKDIFDTADFPTQYGSPIYAGHRPKGDAALVALVRRAGGLALGKTVTTELTSLEPAATCNPRNPAHTPGGSSSGSAAAVAAGMVPIALGSQTGGSVIRPAAYCGVAGFKLSFRLLPTVGMKCFSWSLDTAGLFAANTADVAFAAAVITGRDLRIDQREPAAPALALVRTHQWHEASADMRAAVERAASAAEAAGASVRELELRAIFEEATRAQIIIQDYEACLALAYEFDRHRDQLGPVLRRQLADAAAITPDRYDEARRTARRARQMFANLMADTDAVITPSAPGAAPSGLGSTGNPMFNRLWTLLGAPCVNIPGLTDSHGLPLGVQIVGRFARDRTTLSAALFVERALH